MKKTKQAKPQLPLGELLAAFREARGITQVEMAEKLKMSRSYVAISEFGQSKVPKEYIAKMLYMLTEVEKSQLRDACIVAALEGTGL